MAFATPADLEARLGRSLTADEAARAAAVLDDVSAAIQSYTGQRFIRGVYHLRSRVRRGVVRLSQRPVHDVTAVTDRFGNPVSYNWDGLDRVFIDTMCRPGAPIQVVDVTYEAGPDQPPADIVGVACNVALRALGADPLDSGVVSESIDGYSYRLGVIGSAGSYGLLPDEARVLDRYRRPYGTIRVGV